MIIKTINSFFNIKMVSIMNQLYKEYIDWFKINQFIGCTHQILGINYNYTNSMIKHKNQKGRELRNILSRFNLSVFNNIKDFCLLIERLNREIINKDIDLNIKQKVKLQQICHKYYLNSKIYYELDNIIWQDETLELKIYEHENVVHFHFGYFKTFISQKIYNKLLQITDKINITIMLLRYDRFFPSYGNFWSIPPRVYKYLNIHYNIKLECFSSPLNCYLPKFCSLFPDIDSNFGSLGNFFEVWPKFEPGYYVANPPFIEEIIIKMSNIFFDILDCAEKYNKNRKDDVKLYKYYTFFILIPTWYKFIAYQKLTTSRYTHDIIRLKQRNFEVYNYMTDTYISGPFALSLIVLSNTQIQLNKSELYTLFNKVI